MTDAEQRAVLRREFERAAPTFADRTVGRFDHMNVVDFSRLQTGGSVLEVGVGTGNFLALFSEVAGHLVGIDITPGMLDQARRQFPKMSLVLGDGAALPFAERAFDLVTSAQTLHHVADPVPMLREMGRTSAGLVLIVDQVATERYEEARAMDILEKIRDPSHEASRPPSAFHVVAQAAGLSVLESKVVESEQAMSQWMAAGEFPEERFDRVRRFIEERGHETGMKFERKGDDWAFERRRLMLLCERI